MGSHASLLVTWLILSAISDTSHNDSSNVQVNVIPKSAVLAPGTSVTVVVALRNRSAEKLKDLKVFPLPATGLEVTEIEAPASTQVDCLGDSVAVFKLTRNKKGSNAKSVFFQVNYVAFEPPNFRAVRRTALDEIELEAPSPVPPTEISPTPGKGTNDILSLLGVPTMLALPGFLFLVMFRIVTCTGPAGGSAPSGGFPCNLDTKSAEFWTLAITISATIYPFRRMVQPPLSQWFAEIFKDHAPELSPIADAWVVSVVMGILAGLLVGILRRWFKP